MTPLYLLCYNLWREKTCQTTNFFIIQLFQEEDLSLRKIIKKTMAALSVCLCLSGSIAIYSHAANTDDTMFHYVRGTNSSAVTKRLKQNNTRTYVVYSEGNTPDVAVMGVKGAKQTKCSVRFKLNKYNQYTIKNTVYSKGFKYATLSIYADGYGYGFWSPDSTKNYINLG